MSTSPEQPKMKATLGLTGLTMNAMALIRQRFLVANFSESSL